MLLKVLRNTDLNRFDIFAINYRCADRVLIGTVNHIALLNDTMQIKSLFFIDEICVTGHIYMNTHTEVVL